MNITALLAGLFSGMLGSMGLGGGAVLIVYLSLFTEMGQLKSQGINLLFFVPIALIAVIIYAIKKQIQWKTTITLSLWGMVGSVLGLLGAGFFGGEITSKIFGGMLVVIGVNEIFIKNRGSKMFGFKRKKKPDNNNVLYQMDGREIKYVTKRTRKDDGTVREEILGKTGRIVVLDGEIRVMCGETDVFRCLATEATYYMLLSGDGITVSGVNSINGEKMDIIVYYLYHRK